MNTTHLLHCLGLTASMLYAAGCVAGDGNIDEPKETEETGVAAEAIQDGTPATDYFSTRTVEVLTALVGSCSGTIISPRHVLTAAHCNPSPFVSVAGAIFGSSVNFYGTATTPSTTINVTKVQFSPGVSSTDLYDTNGDFADFAVLTLASPIPASSKVATMRHRPVVPGLLGVCVGRGQHDGNPNPTGLLLQTAGSTMCDWFADPGCTMPVDDEGDFALDENHTNPGDSGGPFFISGDLAGDLYGQFFYSLGSSGYTSVPHHLSRILDMIGFHTTLSTLASTYQVGPVLESFIAPDRDVCSYSCEKNGNCAGYTHFVGMCSLLSSITSTSIVSGATSGKK